MFLPEICNKLFSYKMINSNNEKIWVINLEDFKDHVNELRQYLSEGELKRNAKIKTEKGKLLFCLRKSITRIILSSFICVEPKEIKFEYNPNGKPFIAKCHNKKVSFNISHSKEYLLIGIAEGREIGVDIEKVNLKLNYPLLEESVFSLKEIALYRSYNKSEQLNSFYKAWVQKEAISKAIGVGISIGFNNITVHIDPRVQCELYSIKLPDLEKTIKMSVEFNEKYFLAAALCENEL